MRELKKLLFRLSKTNPPSSCLSSLRREKVEQVATGTLRLSGMRAHHFVTPSPSHILTNSPTLSLGKVCVSSPRFGQSLATSSLRINSRFV